MMPYNNPYFVGATNINPILQGLGAIGDQRRDKAARKEEELKRAEEMERAQREMDSFTSAWDKGDAASIYKMSVANPKFREAFDAHQQYKSGQTKSARRSGLQKILMGGDPEAIALDTVKLIEDAGGDASQTRMIAELAKNSPEEARKQAELFQASLFPDDYKGVMEFRKSQGEGTHEDGQTANIKDLEYYKQLKKTDPESAKSFGMSKGYISKEGIELSSHLQKRLSDASDEAMKSDNNFRKFDVLASEIESSDIRGGIFGGKWGEALKDITGSQDSVTDLRKQYNAIRASQVVNNLPPGAASDTDIALALSGFPSENASKEQLSSFLRGISKLEKINSEYNTFKADYISEKGSERGMLNNWKKKRKAPPLTDEELLEKYG